MRREKKMCCKRNSRFLRTRLHAGVEKRFRAIFKGALKRPVPDRTGLAHPLSFFWSSSRMKLPFFQPQPGCRGAMGWRGLRRNSFTAPLNQTPGRQLVVLSTI